MGAFWGTRVMEIVKKHDSGGLVWKRIKLTTTRKANAKKRILRVWQVALSLSLLLGFSMPYLTWFQFIHYLYFLIHCWLLLWAHEAFSQYLIYKITFFKHLSCCNHSFILPFLFLLKSVSKASMLSSYGVLQHSITFWKLL